MALQTTGEIAVNVNRKTAFGLVSDPLWLVQCVPGCDELHEVSPGRYGAVLSNKVAFITLRFKVIGEIVKLDPPHTIEVKLTGDSVGVAGHLVATAGLNLMEQGEQVTVIRYAADFALTGKLGGLGQPVFRAKSAELAREFGENLKAALERAVVDSKI